MAYIRAVIQAIDMTLVYGPIAVGVSGGVQAHAVIAESHIMVKALADDRIYIDVFSCKDFDPQRPVDLAIDRLGLTQYSVQTIDRVGTGNPADRQNAPTLSTR